MRKTTLLLNIVLSFLLFSLVGCNHKHTNEVIPGEIKLIFTQTVEGSTLAYDSVHYINEAGNEYVVNEIQYFISDIDLYKSDGTIVRLKNSGTQDVFYIDSHLPDTWSRDIADPVNAGSFDSIAFTFGINSAKNKTGLFVNPPEVNMFWPDLMGGGYHLIKMNGTWLDPSNQMQPFNFHMGIGTDTFPTPTQFFDNSFRVHLPGSSFTIAANEVKTININMKIESWFKTPHLWDWNIIGGAIMQNQNYMQLAKENGVDVFSVIIQ